MISAMRRLRQRLRTVRSWNGDWVSTVLRWVATYYVGARAPCMK
jgi:hypothetical protein